MFLIKHNGAPVAIPHLTLTYTKRKANNPCPRARTPALARISVSYVVSGSML